MHNIKSIIVMFRTLSWGLIIWTLSFFNKILKKIIIDPKENLYKIFQNITFYYRIDNESCNYYI